MAVARMLQAWVTRMIAGVGWDAVGRGGNRHGHGRRRGGRGDIFVPGSDERLGVGREGETPARRCEDNGKCPPVPTKC